MSYQSRRPEIAFVALFVLALLAWSAGCADDPQAIVRAPLVGPGCSGDEPRSDGQAASCTFGGRQYAIGATFHDALHCNSCACGAGGTVSCDTAYCDPKDACTVGDRQLASGVSVPCADGCNSCRCHEGSWSSTDVACGPLPKVALCDDAPKGVARVEILYRSKDALALRAGMGGCGGITPPFKLCWDGAIAESFPVQMRLRVVQEEITACSAWATAEKVFDLTPLREAYERAYQTRTGSISVQLDGDSVLYSF